MILVCANDIGLLALCVGLLRKSLRISPHDKGSISVNRQPYSSDPQSQVHGLNAPNHHEVHGASSRSMNPEEAWGMFLRLRKGITEELCEDHRAHIMESRSQNVLILLSPSNTDTVSLFLHLSRDERQLYNQGHCKEDEVLNRNTLQLDTTGLGLGIVQVVVYKTLQRRFSWSILGVSDTLASLKV